MYATVCYGSSTALSLLDELNVGEAKKVLRDSLLKAEDIYVTADEPDELSEPDGQEDSQRS